jgi:probable rRNA maturation factor
MITVNVTKQSSFPVKATKVKKVVTDTLVQNGIVSDAVVNVAIVGQKKMDELNQEYYKDKIFEHPVFTFPEHEGDGQFVFPPDGKMHLGEIVISYPFVVEEAKETGSLIEDVVCKYAEHGALHLVGIHHEE